MEKDRESKIAQQRTDLRNAVRCLSFFADVQMKQWGIHPNRVGATKMKAGLQGAAYITAAIIIIITIIASTDDVKSLK